MSKRAMLFLGWAILAALYFGVNNFDLLPGSGQVDAYGRPDGDASEDGISAIYFLALGAFWYLICFINVVNEWDRRPVLLFGKYDRTLGPGISMVEPLFYTTLKDIPVQDIVQQVAAESVQTKNNVSVGLVGVLTYRISEDKVKDAVVQVSNVYKGILERALSTLTDIAGKKDLDDLLMHRDVFCQEIKETLAGRVSEWGPNVKAFELKGFKINDGEIEKAIAMQARAEKEGQAELVRANMQKQIAAALNDAASTYDDQGRWLKGLETLNELCRSGQNNTILLPTDMVEGLAKLAPFRQ